MLEVNPIPQSVTTDELEQNVCHALSMTGTTHQTRGYSCFPSKVILKANKDRKQGNEVVFKSKELKSKVKELRALDSCCL